MGYKIALLNCILSFDFCKSPNGVITIAKVTKANAHVNPHIIASGRDGVLAKSVGTLL